MQNAALSNTALDNDGQSYRDGQCHCAVLQCLPPLLTLSPPIPYRLYTWPYWSNPPFLIFDIRALWRSVLSARVPECQKFLKTIRTAAISNTWR